MIVWDLSSLEQGIGHLDWDLDLSLTIYLLCKGMFNPIRRVIIFHPNIQNRNCPQIIKIKIDLWYNNIKLKAHEILQSAPRPQLGSQRTFPSISCFFLSPSIQNYTLYPSRGSQVVGGNVQSIQSLKFVVGR